MKKYLSYAIGAIIALFLLTPPWDYHVTCNVNSAIWLWCVVMAGFFAFLFMYTKTPTPVKLMTHTAAPVPFIIYSGEETVNEDVAGYDEESAKAAGLYLDEGFRLMEMLMKDGR